MTDALAEAKLAPYGQNHNAQLGKYLFMSTPFKKRERIPDTPMVINQTAKIKDCYFWALNQYPKGPTFSFTELDNGVGGLLLMQSVMVLPNPIRLSLWLRIKLAFHIIFGSPETIRKGCTP